MTRRRILTVAGSDSGGGAGIQADIKTITALGGYAMSVITALTAQNTLGVRDILEVPTAFVAAQFDAVAEDIGVDAMKTGMLSSPEILRTVADRVRHHGIRRLVVDPVMVAKGGAALLKQEALEVLVQDLLPLAAVVTPNIPEAELLTDLVIASPSDMRAAARILADMGARAVVIKGGHLVDGATNLLLDGRTFSEFPFERIDTRDTHGTGCTFAAAVATFLGQDYTLPEAVGRAGAYVAAALRASLRLGAGHGPMDHLAPLSDPVFLGLRR